MESVLLCSNGADANMIGFFSQCTPSVCPTNGEPLWEPIPSAWCSHRFGLSFIYDAATSISNAVKSNNMPAKKRHPAGWAIDLDGNPHTDTPRPCDLVKQTASLLPIGGTDELSGSHKGYGLPQWWKSSVPHLPTELFERTLGKDASGKPAPYCSVISLWR